MGFVALVFALLIEQGRPLQAGNAVHRAFVALADAVMSGTNAGERQHGVIGWTVIVAGACALVLGAQWICAQLHPLALFALHVLVLYLTVGFRQFSHPFTQVQVALAEGDLPAARRVLAQWVRHESGAAAFADASQTEVCRVAIADALLASHRHVFGPLLWYVLLPGAAGPVLYRLAELLQRRWSNRDPAYGWWADRAFAIVGNFEDAVYAWRGAMAVGPRDDGRALLLAAGGGALGLRLAEPELEARWAAEGQGFEPVGAEPGPESLRSAVGMVWRAVVLWIALFALLSAASWLGR